MSTKNRGDRIALLQKVLNKHFTPVPNAEDRTVLEHIVYACCLENESYEAADEAFHRLQESFFDWNEVRVTTVTELQESLHNLHDPSAAAVRIKKNMQSLFETRYSFDLQDMVKMNQGKAVAELEKLAGMSKFVLSYVTQHALGGHSIPVSVSIMNVLLATEIVSEAEAAKGQAPGLERTIAKTKGLEFASNLHQLSIAYLQQPESKQTRQILKDAGATLSVASSSPQKSTTTTKKSTSKKAAKSKPASDTGASTAKKTSAKKTPVKKAATKKSTPAKASPTSKAPATKKSTKRKPR